MSLLDDVRERIAARRVVVIAGAGVSIAATEGAPCASWKSLLEAGIAHCEEVAQVPEGWGDRKREDLTGDTLSWLSVATDVEERLKQSAGGGDGELRHFLEKTIGSLEVRDPSVIEALAALEVPIATTNYDDLLSEVTGRPAVTWKDVPRIQRVLQGDEPGIIHLHGHLKDPSSIVLGYRSYASVLGADDAQAMQQLLSAHDSLLYVGFGASFEDPNFSSWLEWTRETFGGRSTYRHYRVCRESEKVDVRAQHDGKERIQLLTYEGGHDQLEPFLRTLEPEPGADEPDGEVVEKGSSFASRGIPASDWLIGRDAQLAELVAHLCQDEPEPVSILGGPGMGKTALTVHALRHPAVEDVYPRRVFVRCDGVLNAESLPGAIATELGVGLAGDLRLSLLQQLEREKTVLVLDNFETPWDNDPPEVRSLLSAIAAVPNLSLVVSIRGTSRPTGVPWRRSSFEMTQLEPPADGELFHRLTEDQFIEDQDLEDVLRLAEGVPLVVRLVAAATAGLPNLNWLLEEWAKRRAEVFARGEGKDTNLAISIALSLDGPRLDDASRELASRLALLPDGLAQVDLDALFPVGGRGSARRLVTSGLAFFENERLRMLAPIREAVRRLRPIGDTALRELIERYLGLLNELAPRLAIRTRAAGVASRLEAEASNIDSMLLMDLRSDEPRAGLASAYAYSKMASLLSLGSIEPLVEAERAASARSDWAEQAVCYLGIGRVETERARYTQAMAAFERSLETFTELGHESGRAQCLRSLGDLALLQHRNDDARVLYTEALRLHSGNDDPLGKANCFRGIGDLAFADQEFTEAVERYESAYRLYEASSALIGMANCCQRIGLVHLQQREFEAASSQFEEGLSLYLDAGVPRGAASCAEGRGDVLRQIGRLRAAKSHYEEAALYYLRAADPSSHDRCIHKQQGAVDRFGSGAAGVDMDPPKPPPEPTHDGDDNEWSEDAAFRLAEEILRRRSEE